MNLNERPAYSGELCTCGRQAHTVYVTERYGDVGHCGHANVEPVLPCPFCGAEEPHEARCPAYRLRPDIIGPPGHPSNPGSGGAVPGRVYGPADAEGDAS